MNKRLSTWGIVGLLLWSASYAQAEDVSQTWRDSYALEAAGKVQPALEVLSKLPKNDQQSYLYALRKGWLLYLAGRFAEAVASYQRACELAPRAVEPRLGGLLPLMALKRWQEAEQWAREALKVEPDNYLAARRLALVLYNLGRFDAAEAQYARVLERYPSDLEMLSGVGWCRLRKGKSEAARESFHAVLNVKPDDAAAQSGLASLKQ